MVELRDASKQEYDAFVERLQTEYPAAFRGVLRANEPPIAYWHDGEQHENHWDGVVATYNDVLDRDYNKIGERYRIAKAPE